MSTRLRIFHSEEERDFLAWLGLYVTTWSAVEYGLFNIIKTFSLITKDKFEHKPISFKSKIKSFRTALNHPLLQDELEEAEALIVFLESESDFRHSIIHGSNARRLLPKGEWFRQQWMPERNEEPNNDNITVIDQKTLEDHYHEIGMAIFALIAMSSRTMKKFEKLVTDLENKLKEQEKP